ncbi:MAG: 50S ribosomal protein L19 [Candidatus Margulisbacteria bacterium]|nr:50S ribosomal protein L19 [Candidatus Margulisiibacteriota bacterium]
MQNKIIDDIEKSQIKERGSFNVGDMISVSKIIIEGKKKRTQKFEGTVSKIQNTGSRTMFTVRKVIDRIGVEKSFLLHSSLVSKIDVVRKGKVRRAKLHYLRQRIGSKASRIKAAE